MPNAAVVTVSDRCFQGLRPDEGGPLVAEMLTDAGYTVTETVLVPDEQPQIEAALIRLADGGNCPLIVTTGGTGFAPRDVTPEATLAVCQRLTPGIPEAMRYASLQVTPRAMLSRAQAGIRGGSLIVNLPGSPKAARKTWPPCCQPWPTGWRCSPAAPPTAPSSRIDRKNENAGWAHPAFLPPCPQAIPVREHIRANTAVGSDAAMGNSKQIRANGRGRSPAPTGQASGRCT